MNVAPYLTWHHGAVLLALKVQPRAQRTGFGGMVGTALKLQVTAPPVDSAANEAVVDFLSEVLRLPRRSVSLIRGSTSRNKIVRIDGLSLDEVAARLQGLGG